MKTDSSGSSGSSGSQLRGVASSVSTDSDILPNKGVNRKAVEKLQGQDVGIGNRGSKKALATQMRLNKQLMQASPSSGKKPDIFALVRTHIHQMNAVNLSTAIHRIARLGGPGENETSVLEALLTVIEEKTWRQLQNHDDSMPAGCATIVAWSCASLQVPRCGKMWQFFVVLRGGFVLGYWNPPDTAPTVEPVVICCNAYNVLQFTQWLPTLAAQVFRPDFFGALIQVVEPKLGSCKDVEVTNLLWACAQLVKHQAPEDPGVGRPLSALMDAVEVYFQGRLQEMQSQILVSALVSVAMLSAVGNLSLASLFSSICDALALKSSELSLNNKTQLGVAGRIMTKYHEQVVQAVCKSFSEKCPELATYFRV